MVMSDEGIIIFMCTEVGARLFIQGM